ncbi:Uncharacterised protein [Bordetella pertussis]|nr:Uncharacterised protein [Bordetella pertussis]CFO36929.1 Uncharacterised protein [Bordetella pertussis]CPJ16494.1 Uncharacterised protein [Bordetella pertussis]CPK00321.1 Uncharacterised protein [Bordetella pertussis]CPK98047.1 Uncharacterised protein [Bordetella pertussis]
MDASRRLRPGTWPNSWRSTGSSGSGTSGTLTCLVVYTLTTAGAARATASAYDAPAWPDAAAAGARVAGAGPDSRSQSGRRVVTTNKMARLTVTA